MGTYTVYDTKTGEVIRKSTYGESISDVKLKSRAKTVKKNIKSKTVSEKEARERAKQDLELVARAEQLKEQQAKQLQLEAQKKLQQQQLSQQDKRVVEIAFKESGASFITKAYTPQQQRQILNRLTGSNQSYYYYELQKIDNNKKLNTVQKEQEKRKILNLQPKVAFTKTLKLRKTNSNKQLAELNKLTDSETLAKKVLNGESLTPTQQVKFSKDVNKKSKDLTQAQLKILKGVPKNIGLGVFEYGKEIILFPISAVTVAFKSGYKLSERANKNKESIVKTLGKDYLKASQSLAKISNFVRKNPKTSALIVGSVASSVVGASLKDFVKNPIKSLTKAVLYLNPSITGKAVKVSLKLSKTVVKRIDKFIFSVDEVKDIKKTIKSLESIKGRTRQQSQALKGLKEQLKIYQELKSFTTAKDFEASINKKILKSTPKQANKLIDKINKIDKTVKKKKLKPIKLSDKKKSELLGKLFKKKELGNEIVFKKPKGKFKSTIKDFKSIKNKEKLIQDRIIKLLERIESPIIRESSKKRIKKEVESLKVNLRKVLFDLKQSKKLEETKDNLDKLNQLSNLAEISNKLNKKVLLAQKLGGDLKIINRAIKLLERVSKFNSLSKAQRGQLLKSLNVILKKSFKTKKQVLKPSKKIKKIIERNTFTKEQINNLLKPSKNNQILNSKIKNVEKRITELKKQITGAKELKQYNINRRIKTLEILKQKLIKQKGKPLKDISQAQSIQRFEKLQAKNKNAKIKILSSSVTDNSNSFKIKFGDIEVKIILKTQKKLTGAKKGRLQTPISITISKETNKRYSKPVMDKFKENVVKSLKKDTFIRKNIEFSNKIKQLDKKSKQITNKAIKHQLKSKITLKSKQLSKIQEELKALTKLRLQTLLRLALELSLQLKIQLKIKLKLQIKLQLKLKQKLDLINKQLLDLTKPTKPIKPKTPSPKVPKPKVPKPKVPKPKVPKPKVPKPKVPKPKVPKPKVPKPKTPPKIPRLPKLKLKFDNVKPNQVALFEGVFRERKNINKKAGKSNPIITKKIRIKTTKNRLLNVLSKRVDNSAVRSMQIKVIGLTNQFKKDIGKPSKLKKFRLKKGKKALKLVEKSKYIRDTKGEKREIKRKKK